MEEFFLALGDLPLHPLAVHFAVALFPVALLFLIITTISSKLRDRYLLRALLATVATVPFIFIAQQSGEALSEVMYEPQPHSEYGEMLMPLALWVLAVGFGLGYSLRKSWPKFLNQVLGFTLVSLSIGAIAMTVVIGHSGAAATWTGVIP
ncbi:MAG: hypothetical protein F2536_03295 [Actinobacteria bacterium]|uniref:Unannotated protein n=1 Tax=freshwater metagenome TaxID=449393 RepID=A0A6J6C7A9_9ZZZZ|nr:hypothetical protein [Actinomycetota bacterium]